MAQIILKLVRLKLLQILTSTFTDLGIWCGINTYKTFTFHAFKIKSVHNASLQQNTSEYIF